MCLVLLREEFPVDIGMPFPFEGRTGRFGRKGISVNFVHDKATWQQMEQIERATGRQIVRIETTDLDTMEEVRRTFRGSISITGSWCPRPALLSSSSLSRCRCSPVADASPATRSK